VRIAMFSAKEYELEFYERANAGFQHELTPLDAGLTGVSTRLAEGHDAACIFANDAADRAAITALHEAGVRLLLLRCAGFNNVDLEAAAELGMTVLRVPAYSPHAVAEHTTALILTLNRRIHRAYNRVREGNFSLQGLMGFDLHGRTVGVVGTGKIGAVFARIMLGFGCEVIAADPSPDEACAASGVRYAPMAELLARADIVSLHCPLTPATKHLINDDALAQMKPGAMLVNTSRGAVVDTGALIRALKSERLGGVALDVYEEEADLFFRDLSDHVIKDDVFARLLTFPNVLITAHQAFFTRDAMNSIAETTLRNATDFERGRPDPAHVVDTSLIVR